MPTLAHLLEAIHQEAKGTPFSIDEPVYEKAKRDPFEPILFAGNLESPLCFMGRDLGREEVAAAEPLCGPAGRLVRKGIYEAIYGKVPQTKNEIHEAASFVLLTNTVPYKPIGNKAYEAKVKMRFRPFLEKFLIDHWKGRILCPLGTEALEWFAPYAHDSAFALFCKAEERFTQSYEMVLTTTNEKGESQEKPIILAPLPHPSPLNQKYYALFPGMLASRLQTFASEMQEFSQKLGATKHNEDPQRKA